MCSLVKNKITLCPWATVASRLRGALGEHWSEAEKAVLDKREFACTHHHTALLLRAENRRGINELVVVGLAGDIKTATLACVRLAKHAGFDSIRCHTYRRGQLRCLRRLGLPVECIEERDDGERILQIRF